MAFVTKPRISYSEARRLVISMVRFGDHGLIVPSEEHLRVYFNQRGVDLDDVVEDCRTYRHHVPRFENLVGGRWEVTGLTISRPNHITGEDEAIVSGSGTYNDRDYLANFQISLEDFKTAIQSGHFERFLSSVGAGISAVEAFLNQAYMVSQRIASDDPVLRDPLEQKIRNWPLIVTGRKFDLSSRSWDSFNRLKTARDDKFQHRKSVSSGISTEKHLELLNLYKIAIAQLLLELHIHFGQECPCAIIRCVHFPEILVAEEQNA